MRLAFIALLAAFAVNGMTQASKPQQSVGKVLPTTTKPVQLLPELSGKPLFSVSEHFLADIQKRQRVFRYSWKADVNAFVSKLKDLRVGKNGWALREFKQDGAWELKRASKKGSVIMESYLIKSARLSRDPKTGALKAERTSPGPNGWIWVSYNERYVK